MTSVWLHLLLRGPQCTYEESSKDYSGRWAYNDTETEACVWLHSAVYVPTVVCKLDVKKVSYPKLTLWLTSHCSGWLQRDRAGPQMAIGRHGSGADAAWGALDGNGEASGVKHLAQRRSPRGPWLASWCRGPVRKGQGTVQRRSKAISL